MPVQYVGLRVRYINTGDRRLSSYFQFSRWVLKLSRASQYYRFPAFTMEPLLGDLLGRIDDADYLVTLHKMELPVYTFFEGVSVPSKRDMNILKAARQREKPKTHGNFTIWRNPDSQFSTLARRYMNSGAAVGITIEFAWGNSWLR